jgi:hypothetical protein
MPDSGLTAAAVAAHGTPLSFTTAAVSELDSDDSGTADGQYAGGDQRERGSRAFDAVYGI